MLAPDGCAAGVVRVCGVGPRAPDPVDDAEDACRLTFCGVFFSFSPALAFLARPIVSGIIPDAAFFVVLSFFLLPLVVVEASSSLDFFPFEDESVLAAVTWSTLTTSRSSRPTGS